jgi:zinc protease
MAKQRPQIVSVLTGVLIVLFIVLLPALHHSSAAAQTPKFYTNLKFPPLPTIAIPQYTRLRLGNGITVFLMEDHELPLVNGLALFQTGDRLEPAAQIGLATLTGQVMRSGGTQQHPAAVLNQLLEQRAASVESFVSTASGGANFSCLSEDLETVFSLFTEVIREPAFAQPQIDLAKTQLRGQIARRNDNPEAIVSREFQKLIYGNTSPYARTIEYATLEPLSRNDLVQFHRQYFQPQTLILGIVGDFNPHSLRTLIAAKLGDWQPGNQPTLRLPDVSQARQGGIFFVNQPQLSQSYVQMGHLGGRLDSPNYAALDVLNGVLNGFGGRLFNEIRSRRGLAYSVYAAWSPRYDYPGLFIAGGETRSPTTVPFIQSVTAELQKLQTTPITAEELTRAKDSVLNSFVFNFQDPSQTLSRLLWYEYYRYPQDFLFRYQKAVQSTTLADVQRVAQTELQPDKLVTLVVGNPTAIQPSLESVRPGTQITTLDIRIPEFKPAQTTQRSSTD